MSLGHGSPHPDVKVAGSPIVVPRHRSGSRIPGGRTGLIAAAVAATVVLGGAGALALTVGSDDGDDSAMVAPAQVAPDMAADAQRLTDAERRKLMVDRALRAARQDAIERPALAV